MYGILYTDNGIKKILPYYHHSTRAVVSPIFLYFQIAILNKKSET